MTIAAVLMLHGASARAMEPVYQSVASYVEVPPQILYAMAKAESGMLKNKRFGPWPWTLNIAGKAKRYENRQAMFDGLMAALRAGEQRIDVGPMQLNWYWQFERVGSPWRMTDPIVNIKTAAHILKNFYGQSGDWWEAVGRYHRPADSPKDRRIAEQYRQRVRHFYNKDVKNEGDANAA